MTFNAETSLRLIAESLGLVDRFGADPIATRDVRMSEQTLVVEVVTDSSDPVLVKAEVQGVMGALSGLGIPSLFPSLSVERFGVRAFDSEGQETIWVLSSVEVAKFAARGQPIEWLARSLVQENSPEYRRAQADRGIGRLEITLRDLAHLHGEENAGEDYVNRLWDDTCEMRKAARREERDAQDPRTVLDYAYLRSLGTAIREQLDWFGDGCVPDADLFDEAIARLNKVRMKVAHHRSVTEDDLRVVREAAESVMSPIGHVHPELAHDFLVDRWEQRVHEIVQTLQQRLQEPQIPERGAVTELARRRAAVEAFRAQLGAVEAALSAMEGLVVPQVRRKVHNLARTSLQRWGEALSKMILVAENPTLDIATAEAASKDYVASLQEIGELRKRIQALRLGLEHA
jgi:hypothetical protein